MKTNVPFHSPSFFRMLASAIALGAVAGCGSGGTTSDAAQRATIGAAGGQIVGPAGTALEGVTVVIPAGALAADTQIEIAPSTDATSLPSTAVRCGPPFDIRPAGTTLAVPAQVTLPFDETAVQDNFRFDEEVKVWVRNAASASGWNQVLQTDSATGSVTVPLGTLTTVAAGVNPPASTDLVQFDLHPNPKFLACLEADASNPPSVKVTVVRGNLADGLFLRGHKIKPGLQFDMFTVESTNLLASGAVDPAFKNFGLAWYQSDLEASDDGEMRASIKTILLDQIFGFDPNVGLAPTNTLHVGFWFNNPQDAVACGFDATKPTPFNGEHNAGPLAMITVPDATTNLGPLCTKPDTSTNPATCSP